MTVHLLVADGDPGLRRLLLASLERHGFVVSAVADGDEALKRFRSQRYDVVLLDADMPDDESTRTAEEIRRLAGEHPCGLALMSSRRFSAEEREAKLRESGADALLEKPFPVPEVRERLAELAFRATGATLGPAGAPPTESVAPRRPAEEEPPIPLPGRRTSAAPPPLAESRRFLAKQLLEDKPVTIQGPRTIVAALLHLAREHRTGVLALQHRGAEAKIALHRGVVVGAHDNLPENRLGERLARTGRLGPDDQQKVLARMEARGERFAEAALGLGLCDERTLLAALNEQARERTICAVGWAEGTLRFLPEIRGVEALSGDVIDPYDAVLSWLLRLPDEHEARRWYEGRAEERFFPNVDLAVGLASYAEIRPDSTLPRAFARSGEPLRAALRSLGDERPERYAPDLYALWIAELFRFENDPPADERPVPRRLPPDELRLAVLDREALGGVQREWLRIRGRDLYDVLGVPKHASSAEIVERLRAWHATFGPAAIDVERIGPGAVIAREMWSWMADLEATLLHADQRALYDAGARSGNAKASLDADAIFLEGKLALQQGEVEKARAAFSRATELNPRHVEAGVYLAFTDVLDAQGLLKSAIQRLEEAAHAMPTAVRPLLFLGQAALLRRDVHAARIYLRAAWRRCPDDPEVVEALAELPGEDG